MIRPLGEERLVGDEQRTMPVEVEVGWVVERHVALLVVHGIRKPVEFRPYGIQHGQLVNAAERDVDSLGVAEGDAVGKGARLDVLVERP